MEEKNAVILVVILEDYDDHVNDDVVVSVVV